MGTESESVRYFLEHIAMVGIPAGVFPAPGLSPSLHLPQSTNVLLGSFIVLLDLGPIYEY